MVEWISKLRPSRRVQLVAESLGAIDFRAFLDHWRTEISVQRARSQTGESFLSSILDGSFLARELELTMSSTVVILAIFEPNFWPSLVVTFGSNLRCKAGPKPRPAAKITTVTGKIWSAHWDRIFHLEILHNSTGFDNFHYLAPSDPIPLAALCGALTALGRVWSNYNHFVDIYYISLQMFIHAI